MQDTLSTSIGRALPLTAVLLGLVAALPAASGGLIIPIEQTRTVESSATAGDDFYYDAMEDANAAPDFGAFDVTVSAAATVPGAAGTGGASQCSMIGADHLAATGSISGNSEGWDHNGWARGAGDSLYEVLFELTAPAKARLYGTLEAYDSTYAEALIVGPEQAIFAALAFGPDEITEFDELLALQPGEYRVLVFADGLTHGNMSAPDSAYGEYDVAFVVCPAGDLDSDGTVALSDLATLLSNYDAEGSPGEGDLDGDGIIDLQDLAILLGNYGSTCVLE